MIVKSSVREMPDGESPDTSRGGDHSLPTITQSPRCASKPTAASFRTSTSISRLNDAGGKSLARVWGMLIAPVNHIGEKPHPSATCRPLVVTTEEGNFASATIGLRACDGTCSYSTFTRASGYVTMPFSSLISDVCVPGYWKSRTTISGLSGAGSNLSSSSRRRWFASSPDNFSLPHTSSTKLKTLTPLHPEGFLHRGLANLACLLAMLWLRQTHECRADLHCIDLIGRGIINCSVSGSTSVHTVRDAGNSFWAGMASRHFRLSKI